MSLEAFYNAARATKRELIGNPSVGLTQDEVDALNIVISTWEQAKAKPRVLADPAAFFTAVRKITGSIDQTQVDTINRMLAGASHWSVAWLACGLATAWHEARFKPQPEWGYGKGRPYAKPGKHGQSQYGRGLVQLTWDRNYEWADKALGLDGSLLKDFDRALEPDIASRILVKGMEEGAFTGKSLGDYLPNPTGTLAQFVQSRRIINGTDRAQDIADLAVHFQAALQQGQWA